MRPSADIFLTWFFHSDSTVVTGKNPVTNFSHCSIIDDLIVKARGETDSAKQIQMWKEAGYKLLENNISYAMYVLRFVFARSEKVKWGYDLKSTLNLYTQITEVTDIK
jgi:peptide/nickel transport system substrate-binding protein